jgi:Tfp pilus assembly protein PilN
MIDQISKALPDMTWLTGITQSGYTLTIQGKCLSLTSLSDFVGSLEGSTYFARPVEIIESAVTPGDGKSPELIQFTIRGTFQMQGMQAAPATAPGAKGGRRG